MELHEAYGVFIRKTEIWLNGCIDHLPNLFLALCVLVFFHFLSKILGHIGHRFVAKYKDNASIVEMFSLFLSRFVFLVGIFVALKVIGLETAVSSLLAGAGIIGLALGFAFQDLTANFISGVFIVAGQPIRVGDIVETNGIIGKVIQIRLRSAVIDNGAGQLIEIPSRKIIENAITNYTKMGMRRVQITCEVAYDSDLEEVQRVTIAALQQLGLHYVEKPIAVHFNLFSKTGVQLIVWFWLNLTDAKNPGIDLATTEAIKAIKKAYDANGIRISYPNQRVYMEKEE